MFSFLLSLFLVTQIQSEPSELMRHVWSPYCKGVSLMECPSGQAEKLRDEIRARMGQGENFDAIFVDLNKRYNGVLRMSPEGSGREGLAYGIPFVIFAMIAGLVLFVWLRLRVKKRPQVQPALKGSNSIDERVLKDLSEKMD